MVKLGTEVVLTIIGYCPKTAPPISQDRTSPHHIQGKTFCIFLDYQELEVT
jgi:hypothetical protein